MVIIRFVVSSHAKCGATNISGSCTKMEAKTQPDSHVLTQLLNNQPLFAERASIKMSAKFPSL